jgi:RNA polymerase sigma-70 factor (ECF subfamily)
MASNEKSGDLSFDPMTGASQTDWSLIGEVAEGSIDGEEARAALIERYWPAVYAFVRKAGRDVHDAADLAQGFVVDVMIRRRLFEGADQTRGRFRTFLLRSLKNYMHERHRYETRRRRSDEGRRPMRFSESALAEMEVRSALTPEAAFAAQWSAGLVRRVITDVRAQCMEDGLEAHWIVFEARVVRPMLQNEAPTPYEALIQRLDLADASQASNMMITVKRRFARRLREEVGRTVPDPVFIEDELNALLRDLEQPS